MDGVVTIGAMSHSRPCVLTPHVQESGSVQGSSSSSSSLLQKIMTPATNEYDTGSLKRSKETFSV